VGRKRWAKPDNRFCLGSEIAIRGDELEDQKTGILYRQQKIGGRITQPATVHFTTSQSYQPKG
jgi:hypothetical protein